MIYNLSYILVTRNRLPFLKITLQHLIDTLLTDEEIVVVDGNSTDGSKEYLQSLFDDRKIQQFISEPDENQAHGWNKAMLMARGVLIKKIIDDDVFCYSAIRACKQYMLQNSQVDVVISNDLSSSINDHKHIDKNSRLPQFEKWRNGLVPSFTFGDVHMLIRRASLAHIGLYNISYIMMDWEYSLRISFLKANIAFYTGYNALNVGHLQSVTSSRNIQLVKQQAKRAQVFYEYAGDRAQISFYSKIKIWMGKTYFRAKNLKTASTVPDLPVGTQLQEIYFAYYQKLEEVNSAGEWQFIS